MKKITLLLAFLSIFVCASAFARWPLAGYHREQLLKSGATRFCVPSYEVQEILVNEFAGINYVVIEEQEQPHHFGQKYPEVCVLLNLAE